MATPYFASAGEILYPSISELVQHRADVLNKTATLLKSYDQELLDKVQIIESLQTSGELGTTVELRLSSFFQGYEDVCVLVDTDKEKVTINDGCKK